MMMNKAEKVLDAVEEITDIIDLGTDDIPNKAQIPGFMKESVEAGGKIFQLATTLDKNEYDEAMELLAISIGAKVFENKCSFSDGSTVKIGMVAIMPAEAAPPIPDSGPDPVG